MHVFATRFNMCCDVAKTHTVPMNGNRMPFGAGRDSCRTARVLIDRKHFASILFDIKWRACVCEPCGTAHMHTFRLVFDLVKLALDKAWAQSPVRLKINWRWMLLLALAVGYNLVPSCHQPFNSTAAQHVRVSDGHVKRATWQLSHR